MFRRLILALGAAAASGWAACAAPLEAYGKLPNIEQAEVSPSGALVAYVVTNGEERTIAIQSTADKQVVGTAPAGSTKLRDLSWAGDQHLIVTTSTSLQAHLDVQGPEVENYIAYDLDLKARRFRPLMARVLGGTEALTTIYGSPQVRTVDGKPAVFFIGQHFVDGQGRFGLFRFSLESGAARLVEPGDKGANGWLVGVDGRASAQSLYDDATGLWTLRVQRGNSWRTVQTLSAPIDAPALAGFGRDGKTILVDVDDNEVGSGWRELSPDTGAWGELINVGSGGRTIAEPATGRLIGTSALVGDDHVYTFFDAHDAAVWRGVRKAYPGDLVTLSSWSDDRKHIVVRVDSADLGPAYALVDLTTGQATWLGPEYIGLRKGDVSSVKPVRYKAADGLEITGYLTLPSGRDPHGLPLVVLPHGGPAGRDAPGFDWWAQALASRGYAVLQPNFRGSTGLGGDFYAAGFGEFGRKMQTDLSDGVRHLAQQGLIDPKRVCIVGGSYGGYAALAGATLDRGVYRCAVSYAGPSDLPSQFTDAKQKGGRNALRFWMRYLGATGVDDPLLARLSPAQHAADVQIPVLLIHGRDDTIVTIAQSRKMADALARAGKPVEFVVLDGEDHYLSRGETRLAMLKATVDFLEKNNPPN